MRVLNCKYSVAVRHILDIHLVSDTSRRKCIITLNGIDRVTGAEVSAMLGKVYADADTVQCFTCLGVTVRGPNRYPAVIDKNPMRITKYGNIYCDATYIPMWGPSLPHP